MSDREPLEPIRESLTLPMPPNAAFALFTEQFNHWWPPEYTWAGDVLDQIAIQPRAGGRCFERGPYGFELDWGRVLAWEPPRRLAFTWQISPQRVPVPNPEQASQVEVLFEPITADQCRLNLVHDGFERHGEEGSEYRAALASPQGWPYILERFASLAERQTS